MKRLLKPSSVIIFLCDCSEWYILPVCVCVRALGSCSCGGHGRCEQTMSKSQWRCVCDEGWTGSTCQHSVETNCQDDVDNDAGRGCIICVGN